MKDIVAARAPWTNLILVCGKCARKAGARKFGKHLKAALKSAGAGKRLSVVESDCLGLCPKRRITVASGWDLGRRRLLVAAPDLVDAVATSILRTERQLGLDEAGLGDAQAKR